MLSEATIFLKLLDTAYWLFSQRNTTGSFQIAARLMDSWNAPSLLAPSPKNGTATRSLPCSTLPRAAPTAVGMEEPRIPDSPRMPTLKSARCIEPPLPLQRPVALPKSSAIALFTSPPLAMGWPCDRWLPVIQSSSLRARHAPTATASSPMYEWAAPTISPLSTS